MTTDQQQQHTHNEGEHELTELDKALKGLRLPETFDLKSKLMNLAKQGNPPRYYLQVNYRIAWFRELYPHGEITTLEITIDPDRVMEVEESTWNKEKRCTEKITKRAAGYARFKATVQDGLGGVGQGTKAECRASFDDYVEKAETGAIGRALSALGFGTQFAVEDLESEEKPRLADAPIERTSGAMASPAAALAAANAAATAAKTTPTPTQAAATPVPVATAAPKLPPSKTVAAKVATRVAAVNASSAPVSAPKPEPEPATSVAPEESLLLKFRRGYELESFLKQVGLPNEEETWTLPQRTAAQKALVEWGQQPVLPAQVTDITSTFATSKALGLELVKNFMKRKYAVEHTSKLTRGTAARMLDDLNAMLILKTFALDGQGDPDFSILSKHVPADTQYHGISYLFRAGGDEVAVLQRVYKMHLASHTQREKLPVEMQPIFDAMRANLGLPDYADKLSEAEEQHVA